MHVCHNSGKPPPLLDALYAGSLNQLLHGTEALLVGIAESQEPSQEVEFSAVCLGADGLCLRGRFLHGPPVLYTPRVLQNCSDREEDTALRDFSWFILSLIPDLNPEYMYMLHCTSNIES